MVDSSRQLTTTKIKIGCIVKCSVIPHWNCFEHGRPQLEYGITTKYLNTIVKVNQKHIENIWDLNMNRFCNMNLNSLRYLNCERQRNSLFSIWSQAWINLMSSIELAASCIGPWSTHHRRDALLISGALGLCLPNWETSCLTDTSRRHKLVSPYLKKSVSRLVLSFYTKVQELAFSSRCHVERLLKDSIINLLHSHSRPGTQRARSPFLGNLQSCCLPFLQKWNFYSIFYAIKQNCTSARI